MLTCGLRLAHWPFLSVLGSLRLCFLLLIVLASTSPGPGRRTELTFVLVQPGMGIPSNRIGFKKGFFEKTCW